LCLSLEQRINIKTESSQHLKIFAARSDYYALLSDYNYEYGTYVNFFLHVKPTFCDIQIFLNELFSNIFSPLNSYLSDNISYHKNLKYFDFYEIKDQILM